MSGFLVVSVPAQRRYALGWADHYRALDSAFSGIVSGASDQVYMASLLEDAGIRDSVAAVIRRRGWSGAGDFRSTLMAKPLNTLDVEEESDCVLHFDQFVQTGGHIRLAGWAWDAKSRNARRDVLFVCPDGLICGFGRTGLRRPDLQDAIGSSENDRPGFLGYAQGHHAYGELRVFLLSGYRTACEARIR